MGDIVNLNKIRKKRRKQDRETQAALNRDRFGQSKLKRQKDQAVREFEVQSLNGKRLDRGEREDEADRTD